MIDITYEEIIKRKYPGIIFTMDDPYNLDTYKGPEIDKDYIQTKDEASLETSKLNIEYHKKELGKFIYSQYDPMKQASDIADKNFYQTELIAKGIQNLDIKVVSRVGDFFGGVPFDELLKGISDANERAFEQLLKAAIRITWVQNCKRILRNAIKNGDEPQYPNIPI